MKAAHCQQVPTVCMICVKISKQYMAACCKICQFPCMQSDGCITDSRQSEVCAAWLWHTNIVLRMYTKRIRYEPLIQQCFLSTTCQLIPVVILNLVFTGLGANVSAGCIITVSAHEQICCCYTDRTCLKPLQPPGCAAATREHTHL